MDMNLKAEDFDKEDDTATAAPDDTVAPSLDEAPSDAAAKAKITREKSGIAFPWYDLDVAIGVARVIHDAGGLGVSREQLAGQLNISPTTGHFSIKIGAARMYGLIEVVQAKFQLTQLGYSVLSKDDGTERAARAQAFLTIPLYRRVYEEFKGKPLPPRPTGLENAFGLFGVPAKSRPIARQVFDRSARQSGFTSVDPDRLIEPIIAPSGGTEHPQPEHVEDHSAPSTSGNGVKVNSRPDGITLELDELVRGLLRRLPKEGQKWTPEAKAKWLRALSQNLDYVCEIEGDRDVVIEVRAEGRM